MRAHQDADQLLVEQMLAPPSVDDARSSLDYWQRRQRALPLHRRSARREAREMASRWQDRLRAAERARFEASLAGRLLARVGISRLWLLRARFTTKLGLISLLWSFVPRKMKLLAGAVAAAWLIVLAGALAAAILVFGQVM